MTGKTIAHSSKSAPAAASAPAPAVPRTGRIPNLDGIRGLAFLIVIGSHAGLPRIVPGSVALSAFFMISGYLTTTLFLREIDRTGGLDFGGFYRRRALRLLPPMYITLAVAAILAAVDLTPGTVRFWPVLSQLFCVNNYYMIFVDPTHAGMPEGTSIYWYVAIQEQFYLVFPFLLLFLTRRLSRNSIAILFFALCLAALAWRAILVGLMGVDNPFRTFTGTDTRFDALLYGAILAVAINPAGPAARPVAPAAKYFLLLCGAAILFVSAAADLVLSGRTGFLWRETLRYTLQSLALAPVIYFAVADAANPVFRWLEWRPVKLLGTLSYTLYLVHYVFLYLVATLIPGIGIYPKAIVAFIISFIYAYAMHQWVEKPIDNIRKRKT